MSLGCRPIGTEQHYLLRTCRNCTYAPVIPAGIAASPAGTEHLQVSRGRGNTNWYLRNTFGRVTCVVLPLPVAPTTMTRWRAGTPERHGGAPLRCASARRRRGERCRHRDGRGQHAQPSRGRSRGRESGAGLVGPATKVRRCRWGASAYRARSGRRAGVRLRNTRSCRCSASRVVCVAQRRLSACKRARGVLP